jgi:hypothetical protein
MKPKYPYDPHGFFSRQNEPTSVLIDRRVQVEERLGVVVARGDWLDVDGAPVTPRTFPVTEDEAGVELPSTNPPGGSDPNRPEIDSLERSPASLF